MACGAHDCADLPSLSVTFLSHRPGGALATAQSPETPCVLSPVFRLNFLRAEKLSLRLTSRDLYFNPHMSSQGAQFYWQEQCQVMGHPACLLGAPDLWGDETHQEKPGHQPGLRAVGGRMGKGTAARGRG